MRVLCVLLLVGSSMMACQQAPSEQAISKMVEEQVEARLAEIEATEKANMETIGKLLQGFSSGDTEQINELVHADFKNYHAPEGLQDRAGFHEIVKQVNGIFGSFDEIDLKPAHLFAKGDYVAMMDVGSGTRNGKEYSHVDIHIFKLKDGKMYEHWNSFGLPSQRNILMKFIEESN